MKATPPSTRKPARVRTRARASKPARGSAAQKTGVTAVAPTHEHRPPRAVPQAATTVAERIGASGVLSFGRDGIDVELGPLNILIGTNGSGKSNFVEILEWLGRLPLETERLMRRAGGAHEWLWKGAREGAGRIEVALKPGRSVSRPLHYAVSLAALGSVLELRRETVSMDGRPLFEAQAGAPTLVYQAGSESAVTLPVRTPDTWVGSPPPGLNLSSTLSQVHDWLHYPEITELADALPRFRFYRDWQLGPDAPVRRPQAADAPNAYLAEDASNLAVVLSRIRKSPESKRALIQGVRALYEGIDDVEVVAEGGALRIFVQEGKLSIPATRLSDGTLHWLCLLAVLLDPQPPPLVCIEEPEIALHPDLFQVLARLLRDASQRMQIIVTTHSEALVDKFTDTPEVVIVCERTGNETTMRRLDHHDLAVWLKRYTLGELWRKGEIGGTRW